MLATITLDGYFVGLHIRDYGNVVDVEFREGEGNFDVLRNAKIVMILSHHAMFYIDNKTIIIPMPEISKITKASN